VTLGVTLFVLRVTLPVTPGVELSAMDKARRSGSGRWRGRLANALQRAEYVPNDATQNGRDDFAAQDSFEGERTRRDNDDSDRDHVQRIQTKDLCKQLWPLTHKQSGQHQRKSGHTEYAENGDQESLLAQEWNRWSRRRRWLRV
jgi:hypothetical protein